MSSDAFVVRVDDRNVRKMLGQYTDRELQNRLRRGTRAAGAVYRTGLRQYARSHAGIPRSFRKTKTKTSSSMRTLRTTGIYTSVRPVSPLVSVFEGGAKGHEIAPGKLYATGYRAMLLSGRAGQRWRSRDFVASMPVQHPGMKARPILAPVFELATPAASLAAAQTIFGDQAASLLTGGAG